MQEFLDRFDMQAGRSRAGIQLDLDRHAAEVRQYQPFAPAQHPRWLQPVTACETADVTMPVRTTLGRAPWRGEPVASMPQRMTQVNRRSGLA